MTTTPRQPLDRDQIVHLRLEGLALTALGFGLFASSGESWWLFAVLILAPDLSALGYLAGARVGAVAYNIAHVFTGPAVVIGLGWWVGAPLILALGAIWWSHIAIDRAVGYGLKARGDFKRTHLSF
ncbi:DUF4260 domain-containing protein [Maritimibacter sp. UBA3975]|uniref:DUF4260 domain-containing protein n=1 Tax=Maritimibacter sp. UBA3975 TaxID=1946833 RepID=UPI000C0A6660|nr:DUF4260 domain-containing protein [Maritimibacter sp. UBA3975]MAM60740.1 hypothetical protein [Maritimibacter sp.]